MTNPAHQSLKVYAAGLIIVGAILTGIGMRGDAAPGLDGIPLNITLVAGGLGAVLVGLALVGLSMALTARRGYEIQLAASRIPEPGARPPTA